MMVFDENSTTWGDLDWIDLITYHSDFTEDLLCALLTPWFGAIVGSILIGLAGLIPFFVLPNLGACPSKLKFMLGFAVGGLLGDTFLHLIPEAYDRTGANTESIGLWILSGIFTCVVVEVIFKIQDNGSSTAVPGYLNLFANVIDNFNHGLAVGSSFVVSNKVGFLTTICILVHEIPHEMGDFAVLLKSGFTPLEAGKAQFWTALIGIIGAVCALTVESSDYYSSWILPFTAGGFINVALVTILPDLMKVESAVECCLILSGIVSGIAAMFAVSFL